MLNRLSHHSVPWSSWTPRRYLSATQVVLISMRLKGIQVEDRETSINMNRADLGTVPHFDPPCRLDGHLKALLRR